MNVNRKIIIFFSFVAAVTTGIMIFYAGDSENIKEEKQVYIKEENIEEPQNTPSTEYEIMLEGNAVVMYRTEGELREEVDRVEIDIGYYPAEDIKELSQGITAYNIEEGYRILENFAN